jgi:hypothetical protein
LPRVVADGWLAEHVVDAFGSITQPQRGERTQRGTAASGAVTLL